MYGSEAAEELQKMGNTQPIVLNLHGFQAKSAIELTARSYVEMLFLSQLLRSRFTHTRVLFTLCVYWI